MFSDDASPRIFGVPPGADFPKVLCDNVLRLTHGKPPEALARVNILVATRRMQRRMHDLFQDSGARLLPKIGVVTDVTHLNPGADLPAPISTLRRTLELKPVVERLIDMNDTLSRGSAVDLTESLAKLLDEIHSEGVSLKVLDRLAPLSTSGHWEQSLEFLQAIRPYLEALSNTHADGETRHRAAVLNLCARWEVAPPRDPVIVAGSTGSRDTTRHLMRAVSMLPQGAVVLPGFDTHLPEPIWTLLTKDESIEEHPQFRFARLLSDLDVGFHAVQTWSEAPSETRNALISLSLNPAGETGTWRTSGPEIGDLTEATCQMSLMETDQPRDEALAIALAMRHAVAEDRKVALIAPDATLARRVTAALERWGIRPDDSGGTPLQLTASGRFLRHIGEMIMRPLGPADLIPLLKHPYTYRLERGAFQLFTQRLEVFLRRRAVPVITPAVLAEFGDNAGETDRLFASWVCDHIESCQAHTSHRLADHVGKHVQLAEAICTDDAVWDGTDGEAVRRVITNFSREASYEGFVSFSEYFQMLERALAGDSDREQLGLSPNVSIWGPLEARVQGADVVILGGLNEGVWPEQPAADPWLNRQMRQSLGLLLPERQIGLAAHDYQQAAGAPEVIFSRARRSDDSETVPSRWLNRLTNLLGGLPETRGPEALEGMRARGQVYVRSAALLDQPQDRTALAERPAPAPPPTVRPKTYSVTEIQRLIRDPYAVYAGRILRLRPLDPLSPSAGARLKGVVFHDILRQAFSVDADFSDREAALERFGLIAKQVLDEQVHWPTARRHWWGHLASIAETLVDDEMERRKTTEPLAREVEGTFALPGTPFRINGTADRIDRRTNGLIIYDYKTSLPSKKDLQYFDRQLVIEALMAESGAFKDIAAAPVSALVHVGIGRQPKQQEIELAGDDEIDTVSGDLARLLTTFDRLETGYIARRAMESLRYDGDYDHLSRFGEWDASAATTPEPLE